MGGEKGERSYQVSNLITHYDCTAKEGFGQTNVNTTPALMTLSEEWENKNFNLCVSFWVGKPGRDHICRRSPGRIRVEHPYHGRMGQTILARGFSFSRFFDAPVL